VRRFSQPERDALLLPDVLYALSDPTRLRIVVALADGDERPCGAGAPASVPKSTLAHHFKVLRETGVLATRAEGTQSFNSLRRADLDARFPGLLDAVLRAARACPGLATPPAPG
jgi:DNA-binding transcriptional ArsR family regulator